MGFYIFKDVEIYVSLMLTDLHTFMRGFKRKGKAFQDVGINLEKWCP